MKSSLLVAASCSACMRLLDVVARTPSLQAELEVVDVTRAPASLLRGVTAVPSIVQRDGRVISGTACFEYAKKHEKTMELDCASDAFGCGGMLYSNLDDAGAAASMRFDYGEF